MNPENNHNSNRTKKIIDNPTSSDLLKQLQGFENLEALYKFLPFSRRLFPKADKIFSDLKEIKKQSEILYIPDQFNERFSSHGWVAYDYMNMDVMKLAISTYDSEGKEAAEILLADSYDNECLEWGIRWFKRHPEFEKRIRLAELAKDDYLAGRYHACIPLLLSLLDGLVNDVSRHVGFFAEPVDLTAWDCIAAHESGLQTLSALMSKGRNKTNEEAISIPYRNGILHGRELAFDNKLVAAKTWAALFAARDWAVAIADGKKSPKPKEETTWRAVIKMLIENAKQKNLLEAWSPRLSTEITHLPHAGMADQLPTDTPERAVAEFIENWISQRYGLLAGSLLNFTKDSQGKKALWAKRDFSMRVPASYRILSVDDQAAAASHVETELYFEVEGVKITRTVSVRAIYRSIDNEPRIRSEGGGEWKIVQNSLMKVLYEVIL